ncbi:MAG: hypothetical protein SFU56_08415 [Capsulimonadales bacterium]|nr:hypothetical protein [Capsulimonadales bacterium]
MLIIDRGRNAGYRPDGRSEQDERPGVTRTTVTWRELPNRLKEAIRKDALFAGAAEMDWLHLVRNPEKSRIRIDEMIVSLPDTLRPLAETTTGNSLVLLRVYNGHYPTRFFVGVCPEQDLVYWTEEHFW